MFEKLGKNPEFQKVYKQGRSKEGNRIIIVARKDVKNKNFKEVDGAVFHLLKIHGILK